MNKTLLDRHLELLITAKFRTLSSILENYSICRYFDIILR